jgi:hypothetical protein
MPRLDRKGLVLAALLASVLPEGGDAFCPAHVVRTVRTGGALRQEGVIVASSAGGNDEEAYYGGAQGEGNRNRGPGGGEKVRRIRKQLRVLGFFSRSFVRYAMMIDASHNNKDDD